MDSKQAKLKLKAELFAFNGTRKQWYWSVYLRSEHWKTLREKALAAHGRKCCHCPTANRLDVHHLRYKSIYDVTVKDLQILCRPCHELEHAKAAEKPKRRKPRAQRKYTKRKAPQKVSWRSGLDALDSEVEKMLSGIKAGYSSQKNAEINKLMKRLRKSGEMTEDLRLRLMAEKTGAKARKARSVLLQRHQDSAPEIDSEAQIELLALQMINEGLPM